MCVQFSSGLHLWALLVLPTYTWGQEIKTLCTPAQMCQGLCVYINRMPNVKDHSRMSDVEKLFYGFRLHVLRINTSVKPYSIDSIVWTKTVCLSALDLAAVLHKPSGYSKSNLELRCAQCFVILRKHLTVSHTKL